MPKFATPLFCRASAMARGRHLVPATAFPDELPDKASIVLPLDMGDDVDDDTPVSDDE